MRNIILIGFMGCGKTSVGIRLSYRMKQTFLDTDKLIERDTGRTISEIFEQDGEKLFRQMETDCLKRLTEENSDSIISVGGGLPLRQENRLLLKKLGLVIYLKAEPATIYERLKNDTSRPLLQTEEPEKSIRELLEKRKAMYEEAADVVLPVDGKDFDRLLQEIEDIAEKENTKMNLLVINGPNLNFLGVRDKEAYGTQSYDDLLMMIGEKGEETGSRIEVFQSNHEGAIIDRLQDSYSDATEGILINPGAFTHYSYAIRDALESITVPKVEVHISDIMNREDFRKVSVTAPVCDKQIYGQGFSGYKQGIDFLLSKKTVEK